MEYLTKTYQGRIYPNKTTKKQLQLISKGCNFVYNYFLSQKIECDKNKNKQPYKYEQEEELVQLKKDNPWLKEIYSQILQEIVVLRIVDVWRKYQKRKKINPNSHYPRFKTDNGWYDSFTYLQNNSFKIEKSQVVFSQGKKDNHHQEKLRINLKLNQPIKGIIKTLTISWKKEKYFANLTCDIEIPPQIPKSEIKRMTGIDRNVRKLFANSEGWKYYNPKYWEKIEERYIALQRLLSRKEKKSNNWKKVKSEMTRIGQKVSNRMKDLNHKLSRKLVNKFDLLAFEKLNTAEMVKKKDDKGNYRKVGKYTADGMLKACWSQLALFTTYKVQETGKWVEFVNPSNTSKRCFECGEINKKLGSEEIFLCPSCENKDDRDVNAAKNILYKAQVKLGLDKRLGTLSAEPI